jgi:hypothetical protein
MIIKKGTLYADYKKEYENQMMKNCFQAWCALKIHPYKRLMVSLHTYLGE